MTQDSPTAERLADDFPTLDRQDEEQLLPQLVSHLQEHAPLQVWANDPRGTPAQLPKPQRLDRTRVYTTTSGLDRHVEALQQ